MTAALEGVSGQQHTPAALYPPERHGTHFTEGWVGSRAGLDGREISSPPGFDSGPFSPWSVAIRTELLGPHIYANILLNSSHNDESFRKKFIEEIKTHILRSIKCFRKPWFIRDNVEKCCGAGEATDNNIIRNIKDDICMPDN